MKNIEDMLYGLSKSKFRSSFHLNDKMIDYIDKVGMDKINSHAYDLIKKSIYVAPINDGKQTPMKNHPVFIAQHACACCCRGCLEKWYKIPKNRPLKDEEIDYIIKIIMTWIKKEYNNHEK